MSSNAEAEDMGIASERYSRGEAHTEGQDEKKPWWAEKGKICEFATDIVFTTDEQTDCMRTITRAGGQQRSIVR